VHDSLRVRGKSFFLHTELHHDDIMLEYLHVVLIATQPTFDNKRRCLHAKSGFNSVSNPPMLKLFERCVKFIICGTWQSLTRPGGQMTDRFCPDHDGMWTIVVVTFETDNSLVLLLFGPPVWGTLELPIFSAEPVVGSVEDFVYGCGDSSEPRERCRLSSLTRFRWPLVAPVFHSL